jgi:hypothetical protein
LYRPPWQIIDSLFRRGDIEFVEDSNLAVESTDLYFRTLANFVARNGNKCVLVNVEAALGSPSTLSTIMEQRFGVSPQMPDPMPIFPADLKMDGLDGPARFIESGLSHLSEAYYELERVADMPGRVSARRTVVDTLRKWGASARRREPAISQSRCDAFAAFLAIGRDVVAVEIVSDRDYVLIASDAKSFVGTVRTQPVRTAPTGNRLAPIPGARLVVQDGPAIPLPIPPPMF